VCVCVMECVCVCGGVWGWGWGWGGGGGTLWYLLALRHGSSLQSVPLRRLSQHIIPGPKPYFNTGAGRPRLSTLRMSASLHS
jgi:hypothetical protein